MWGTWLESHLRWQIRIFWFALLWAVGAIGLIFTFVGMVFGFPLIFVVGVWVNYPVLRGWIKLASREPMPMPAG